MSKITKVLIANRGEIAVRIVRACADSGISSVAVYADQDRQSLHVRLADDAYALNGARAADTYLDIAKLLEVARVSGADAVHPGYGFLAERADFAQAVIDAGLIWIGPSPAAIDALGDKVSARHIAKAAGAPLVPGTPDPVESVAEIHEFVAQHGLPIAIKAAFGGGGRGIKVVREAAEIDEAYESAVREAVAAFGRGECFVERFLDRPRHVETQCLADQHGTVVVVSTRDCSLQRRHQKLVEEAPAPFLTEAQISELYRASEAIMREAKYVGAGTCEFLVGVDGTLSFLEVNTRLQVEHPVSEEISGIDLVREQLRIANGEALGYDHVETRGHSFEFRINGEDPARNFMPTPGTITSLELPAGPGVRVDTGVVSGDVISGAFDSMIAKLIVTGATREQAIERSKRALAELTIDGIPTVIPFHRAVLGAPAFAANEAADFTVHTRWIETEFAEEVAALSGGSVAASGEADAAVATERLVVEVGGKRLEVVIPAGLSFAGNGAAGRGRGAGSSGARKPARRSSKSAGAGVSTDALCSPMQGTIVKVAVEDGAEVNEGDLIVVLEAMKMEQPLLAHRSGVVSELNASVGDSVSSGTPICTITPA